MALNAVSAVVYPATIRIAHCYNTARSNKIAAVVFMPFWRREALDVYRFTFCNIFNQRAAIHLNGWVVGGISKVMSPPLYKLVFRSIRW